MPGNSRRAKACAVAANGRRRRRLTLAPSRKRTISPSSEAMDEEEDEEKAARRVAEGREALSRMVTLVVEASERPKPVHGVQVQAEAIQSKFWARHGDQEDSSDDDEPVTPSTPEFVDAALQEGFTVDQLLRAEKALNSGTIQGNAVALSVGKSAAA